MSVEIYLPIHADLKSAGDTHNLYSSFGYDPTWTTIWDIQKWALLTRSPSGAKFNSAEIYAEGQLLSQLSSIYCHDGKFRVILVFPGNVSGLTKSFNTTKLQIYLFQ